VLEREVLIWFGQLNYDLLGGVAELGINDIRDGFIPCKVLARLDTSLFEQNITPVSKKSKKSSKARMHESNERWTSK
jgi:hypothetical protein